MSTAVRGLSRAMHATEGRVPSQRKTESAGRGAPAHGGQLNLRVSGVRESAPLAAAGVPFRGCRAGPVICLCPWRSGGAPPLSRGAGTPSDSESVEIHFHAPGPKPSPLGE